MFNWNRAFTYRLCTLFPNFSVELLLHANVQQTWQQIHQWCLHCTKSNAQKIRTAWRTLRNREKHVSWRSFFNNFNFFCSSQIRYAWSKRIRFLVPSLIRFSTQEILRVIRHCQWIPIFCCNTPSERCGRVLKKNLYTMLSPRYRFMIIYELPGWARKATLQQLPRTCDGCPGIFGRVFDQAACCSYLRNSSCWTKQGIARQSLFYMRCHWSSLFGRCGGHQPNGSLHGRWHPQNKHKTFVKILNFRR